MVPVGLNRALVLPSPEVRVATSTPAPLAHTRLQGVVWACTYIGVYYRLNR